MSTVETPAAPDPAGLPRQCPRCGATMTEQQEWCLRCGAAVGTRIAAAGGSRAPFVLAAVLLTLAAVAIAIAIIQLADDTDEVASTPPANATPTAVPTVTITPAPTATPAPTLTPDPTATPTPTTTPSPTPSGGDIAEWPAGRTGWTVVLSSETSQSTAEREAEEFADQGITGVGVLHSDDFASLRPGYWVVFAGQYDSQQEATEALDGIDAPDAYIRRIEPD